MQILLYEWTSYLQYDVEWVCKEKGIAVEKFSWKFTDKNVDEVFLKWFRDHIDGKRFDVLFSVNYWPLLSEAAQEQGMKYIAWCYDNPLNVVNIEKTLGNPVNTVIFFDRIQTEKYLNAGFRTVHYMPLCVNSSRLRRLRISDYDDKRYTADVALVGSLYESRMQELKSLMDEYTKGYLDAVLAAQQNLYGCYLFDDVVTEEFVDRLNQQIKESHPETKFHLLREALTFAMASEVTRKDRLVLLTILGRRYHTRLYSFQTSDILKGVECFPPVDYVSEMPKVFACSRINLNPILRCIQSGIPLRALDVMGSGGFLLSSYQPELAEFFTQEAEMVMYEGVEDAVEKADFFLKHEDIRKQIALRGQAKVLEQYSLQERWDQIWMMADS